MICSGALVFIQNFNGYIVFSRHWWFVLLLVTLENLDSPVALFLGHFSAAAHRSVGETLAHFIARVSPRRLHARSPHAHHFTPHWTMAAAVASTAPVLGRAPRLSQSAATVANARLGIQPATLASSGGRKASGSAAFGRRAGAPQAPALSSRRNLRISSQPPSSALPENADALLLDDGEGLLSRIATDVDCIVMDCDGVIWQGDTLLPGARESIALLREQGKRLVFVTNNSNKSRAQYVYKFEQLGIAVEKEEIFSAAFAAAAYLKTRKFDKKAFVVGGRGIVDELNDMQIEVDPGVFNAVQCTEVDWEDLVLDVDVGAVIVGQDVAFTYAKLAYASLAIQRGAVFVATNPDAADSLGPGMMPGSGAIVAAVETASGRSPEIYAGKPSAFLLELLKGNHVDMSRTLVVGDRLDTDIAFGKAGGAGLTVLTLAGVSTLDDVDDAIESARNGDDDALPVPDFIVQGLPQMLGLEPEDAAAMELVEEQSTYGEEENELGEYLEEEGFDDEQDQEQRNAFGGRE